MNLNEVTFKIEQLFIHMHNNCIACIGYMTHTPTQMHTHDNKTK